MFLSRVLCDGPILRPEESYRVWRVLSVIRCYSNPLWADRGQTVISIQLELLQADIAAVNIRLTGEFATPVPIQIIIL